MRKFLIILCMFLILILPTTGSLQNDQSDSIQEIQVGAVLPLDGQWASIGRDSDVALYLAMDTLNDYLKPSNLKITLHIENSSSDPQKALESLKKLHDIGIVKVIGPCTSAEATAMVPYANEHDILLLSPSSTALYLALDDNLFRLAPNDGQQTEALAQLIQRQNLTQVLVVYLNDEYGSGMNTGLKTKAADPKYGFQVIDSVSFDPAITNYTSLVDTITTAAVGLQNDTGAIMLIGTDSHAVGIFTTAGIQSPISEYKWFSGDGIIHEADILKNNISAEFAAKTRLEGFAFACEDTITMVPTMMAAGIMSAELGAPPSPAALLAWDAIWLIGETYRLGPQDNLENFKSAMRSVSGKRSNVFNQIIDFDTNGDIIHSKYARFMVIKDHNGEIYWNLVGMFIKNKTSGAFLTDADGNNTRESGDIIIGAVLPMTGPEMETGKGAKDAIELAVEHANTYYSKTTGLNIHFSFDIRDSASDPATSLSQVKALHEAGINLIVMGGNSAELSAVQEYCRNNNIIILGTRSTAVSLSDSDDYVYRLSPDDTNQAKAMVRLMETQGKKHLVVLYRDDVYGQDFQKAISETFTGSTDCYGYPVNQSDFSSILDNTSALIEKTGTYQDTAVVVIGLKEVVQMLETIKDGPLTSVVWYGTDGIAQSRSLLSSSGAVSAALKTNLTCSNFDVAAQPVLSFMNEMAVQYLSRAVGGAAGWNELSNYDAAWMAMNAYALTSPDAGYKELWGIINNPYGAGGVGGLYVVNKAQDQSLSSYSFYRVTETSSGPEWNVTAYYRDVMTARDDLVIMIP
ncbi:MAG TPA: ABC transporter substrate-binding protein [Methanospirillum sp.]|nr:ABC transporter substrate-binding protein [Methanospirillum sp.]